MKTYKLKDLIDNKDNPKIVKKILDSTELSKLDKKDILKDLKGVINKEELILDSDTIQQKCYFVRMDNLTSFLENGFPQNEIWSNQLPPHIQFLSNFKCKFCKEKPIKNDDILGFRYNIASTYDTGYIHSMPNVILEYFIEVPFTRFYDKDTNFFCYEGNKLENGKELYKKFSKLNLVEGEWFDLTGYIFMIPDIASNNRGIITKVRKEGNIFRYESYKNSVLQDTMILLPTGEVK